MRIKELLKKEILDGLRNYRFLIIASIFFFLAIFNPVMTKFILPELLRSQFPEMPEEAIQSMLTATQSGAIQGYLSDIFQLGLIVVVFTLAGILANEISEKTLIQPICTGKKYGELLISKLIIYGSVLLIVPTTAAFINYIYTGVLFEFGLSSPMPAVRAGLLQGLYMVFALSLLILLGSLIKKAIPTGLIVLFLTYTIPYIGNLLGVNQFLPSGLITEAGLLTPSPSPDMVISILSTIVLVSLAIGFTILRLKKIELAKG